MKSREGREFTLLNPDLMLARRDSRRFERIWKGEVRGRRRLKMNMTSAPHVCGIKGTKRETRQGHSRLSPAFAIVECLYGLPHRQKR